VVGVSSHSETLVISEQTTEMSGKLFTDVSCITLFEYKRVLSDVGLILYDNGIREFVPVGTTGLKEVMGDLDFAASHPTGRDGLMTALEKRFQVRATGKDLVSFRFPLEGALGTSAALRFLQVDVFVGDVKFLKWARAGTIENGLKGADRAVLLNTVLKWKSWTPKERLDRERWALDFGEGLFWIKQTKRGRKPSSYLKNWKTLSRELKSIDPHLIVDTVFMGQTTVEQTMTVRGCVEATTRAYPGDVGRIMLEDWRFQIANLATTHPDSYGDPKRISELITLVRSV
jgi:hypothetical protein